MREVTPSGAGPGRRVVTLGLAGAALLSLGGCGIRLEDDAPRVPLVPTREPIPAEPELVRLLGTLRSVTTAPVVAAVPLSRSLAALHRAQATVLHDALRQRGVPEAELAAPTPSVSPTPSASATPTVSATGASPSSSASPTPSTSATPTGPAAVVAQERSILQVGGTCAAAEAELRPTLLATLAQASAAIELLSGQPGQAADPTPWASASALVPVLTATRTAAWLLEVAGARSDKKVRAAVVKDLPVLSSVVSQLVVAAGDAAPAAELGHRLPFPVATEADAQRLARQSMSDLLGEWGSALAQLAESGEAFASVPTWLGSVAAVAHRRGVPLTAFPGLE